MLGAREREGERGRWGLGSYFKEKGVGLGAGGCVKGNYQDG